MGSMEIHTCSPLEWLMVIAYPPICTADSRDIMRRVETKCWGAAWLFHRSGFEGYFLHPLPPAGASIPPDTASAVGRDLELWVMASVTYGMAAEEPATQTHTHTDTQTLVLYFCLETLFSLCCVIILSCFPRSSAETNWCVAVSLETQISFPLFKQQEKNCDVMRGRVILGRYIPATWLTQGLQTIMAPRTTDYNPQPAGQPGPRLLPSWRI